MESFKNAAIVVLKQAGRPLHYREITQIALDQGILKTEGKTPWATMNAEIYKDIAANGESSVFVRGEPGFFSLRNIQAQAVDTTQVIDIPKAHTLRHEITAGLNTKQKGDIAEARVAELITLYGKEGLSCYKPISDHEGIDLIVKRRGKLQVSYIQVKSSFGYKDGRGIVSSVREQTIVDKHLMLLVFLYFDLSEGDVFDHMFCIPAPDFLRLTKNEDKKPGERVFSVSLLHPENSKYAEFLIEKRELANKIIELMDKI